MKIKKVLAVLIFLCCFAASSAHALRVKQMNPETGIFTLDDTRQIRLAGINLDSEAYKSLAILFAGQDIEIDQEKALLENIPAVYLSVKSLEIPFPFKANVSPRGTKLAVNEMLISLGLSSVDETKPFKRKEAYLKLQEEARRLGKGMWSEETSAKKK